MNNRINLLLAALVALAVAPLTARLPLDSSAHLGGGERHSPWFGNYNAQHYPWIFHRELGWMYLHESATGSLWLWTPGLGWSCTREGAYPNLYEQRSGWLHYAEGSQDPRRFYDYGLQKFMVDEALPARLSYYPVPGPQEEFLWRYVVNGGKAVAATFDGINLQLTFTKAETRFRGGDLGQTAVMEAGIGGNAYIEGRYYTLGGSMATSAEQQFSRTCLGLYTGFSQADMVMLLTVGGQEFSTVAGASIYGFDNMLISFPWQENLYQLPVGTVVQQVIHSGWISANYSIEVKDHPEQNVGESFEMPFYPYPSARWEITGKQLSMTVRGRTYQKVVSLNLAVAEPDPFEGTVNEVQRTLWLAPGVGIIKYVEAIPFTDTSVTVELSYSNLW